MKKVILVVLAVLFSVSMAIAQETAPAMPPAPPEAAMPEVQGAEAPQAVSPAEVAPVAVTMMVTGDIIDNMCAEANKEKLGEFVQTHSKECALKCADNGYSIYTSDGMLMKFDGASNAKIVEFLNGADSKTAVAVEVTKNGDELSLISIKNKE